jgi:hypothetical protein
MFVGTCQLIGSMTARPRSKAGDPSRYAFLHANTANDKYGLKRGKKRQESWRNTMDSIQDLDYYLTYYTLHNAYERGNIYASKPILADGS